MSREQEIYKVTLAGSVGNMALLTFKFVAAVLGHSSAMMADAIHSLSDFITDLVVLVFVRLSAKPQDQSHDYGHGKFETFATFIIGLALVVAAVGIIVAAVLKVVRWAQGATLEAPGILALWAALLSILVPSGDDLFYESFDQCDGTGGNDDLWSGSIASSAFKPDNEGWSTVTATQYGGDHCARFGSSKKDGTTTSPSFTLNGTTTLTFKAAPWGDEDCSLVLSVNETILGSIDLANNQWTEYTIEITGNGNTTLKFQPTTKRFFLDEVKVANPTTTAIRELKLPQRREPEGIYTLDGRYLGSDRTVLSRGIYIVNGKKMVIK